MTKTTSTLETNASKEISEELKEIKMTSMKAILKEERRLDESYAKHKEQLSSAKIRITESTNERDAMYREWAGVSEVRVGALNYPFSV